MHVVLAVSQIPRLLVLIPDSADPPGCTMQYVDANGKVREVRGESQQEAEFAPLANLLPGHNMSLPMGHLYLTCHLYK